MKRLLAGVAGLALLAGAAHAQGTKTIAVSVPTADHGWTGGVVYFAMEEAKALEKKYPGLKVIVKTSADPAARPTRWKTCRRRASTRSWCCRMTPTC